MSILSVSLPQCDRWIVVSTHAHREHLAIENLQRQAFNVYCPMMRKVIRHARRAHEALRPLFPGYLLVEANPKSLRWKPVLSTYGVRSILCCGKEPSYLSRDFVVALKAREVDGAIVRPSEPYVIGQSVSIAGGAFAGVVATIIEMDEKNRLVVLLKLLNGSVKVKIDAADVRAG